MKLQFLGTGGGRFATISQKRMTGGFRIDDIDGKNIHVDPGPGALVRTHQYGLNPRKLNLILISHCHTDHYTDAEVLIEAIRTKSIVHKDVELRKMLSDRIIKLVEMQDNIGYLDKYNDKNNERLAYFNLDGLIVSKDELIKILKNENFSTEVGVALSTFYINRAAKIVPCFLRSTFILDKNGVFEKLYKNPNSRIYFLPQHCLYFLPLPHGHGSFGYIFFSARTFGPFATLSSLLVPVTFATCSLSTFCSTLTWKRSLTVSTSIARVISPNISYPIILYSTRGSLCP